MSDFGSLHLVASPSRLWQLYVEYLWSPAPGSWISSAASTFRILAVLSILPFVILTLLDVTSYVIARTLGVVETTRASTNDTDTRAEVDGVLLTQKGRVGDMRAVSKRGLNNDETTTGYALREAGGFDGSKESIAKDRFFEPQPMTEEPSTLYRDHDHEGDLGPPAYFFSPEEEKNLTLSGVNVFSPAVSRQGSPSIERDRSQRITPMPGGSASAYASDLSASSTMLGESFTILESDELADKFSSLRRRGGVSSADPTHTQP